MQSVIDSLSKLVVGTDNNAKRRHSEFDPSLIPTNLSSALEWKNDPCRNPALPIVPVHIIQITTNNILRYNKPFFSIHLLG